MKVPLQKERSPAYRPKALSEFPFLSALPFFKGRRSEYVHRVRYAKMYKYRGQAPYTAVSFWCGGSGFLNKGGFLIAAPGDDVLCATCEGRAVGAGQVDAGKINGRAVRFRPRAAIGESDDA